MTWIEWATIVGFAFTLIAFAFTWWQIAHAVKVNQAVDKTLVEINWNTANIRLKQSLRKFRHLYNEAQKAAEEGDRKKLQRMLEGWAAECSPTIVALNKLEEQKARPRRQQLGKSAKNRMTEVSEKVRSAQGEVTEALKKMEDHPYMADLRSGTCCALKAMREISYLATAAAEESRYLTRSYLRRAA